MWSISWGGWEVWEVWQSRKCGESGETKTPRNKNLMDSLSCVSLVVDYFILNSATDVGWVSSLNPTTIFLPYGRSMERPYPTA